MHAEVISIGDELTSGQRLDTNSQWLSERLGELGVRVLYHTTVADDLEANVRVFRQAVERADIIVASGGLGPTADDLTRDALAAVSGQPLEMRSEIVDHIRSLFALLGRDMPERNTMQAMFPRGSRVIPNPHGTAPGIDLEVPRAGNRPARIFALPGVPAELFEMWRQTVESAIAEWIGIRRVIRHRRLKCFGAGESHVEQMLPDLIRRGRDPSVGITVSGAVITLRITAAGDTPEACFAAMEPTVDTIRECLKDLVYGEEEDELEHAVLRQLDEQQLTLATIEWGTGGQVADWLNNVPSDAARFAGGLVVTNEAALEKLLDLPSAVVAEQGACSGKVVEEMAARGRVRFGTDLALATSAVPRLDKLDADGPRIYFALASSQGVIVRSTRYAAHPSILRVRAARQALNMVRLALLRGLASEA
ncbi:MAG: CinA family nicotinamide mononucleotide deamidase-related protein [Pirellulales bacterium]